MSVKKSVTLTETQHFCKEGLGPCGTTTSKQCLRHGSDIFLDQDKTILSSDPSQIVYASTDDISCVGNLEDLINVVENKMSTEWQVSCGRQLLKRGAN